MVHPTALLELVPEWGGVWRVAGGSFSSWTFSGLEAPGLSVISKGDCVFSSPCPCHPSATLSWLLGILASSRPPVHEGEIRRGLSFCHLLFCTPLVPPGIFGHLIVKCGLKIIETHPLRA